jgi:hypothetical protein
MFDVTEDAGKGLAGCVQQVTSCSTAERPESRDIGSSLSDVKLVCIFTFEVSYAFPKVLTRSCATLRKTVGSHFCRVNCGQ